MEARKERISIIVVSFDREVSPMIVKSGKFHVSGQKILETNRSNLRKATSQLAFLGVKVFLPAAIRQSLTLQKQRIRSERARSVLIIERGVVLNNKKPSSHPNKILGKIIQDHNLTFRAKVTDRGYSETLIMTLWLWHSQRSNLGTESLIPFQQHLVFSHTISSNSA